MSTDSVLYLHIYEYAGASVYPGKVRKIVQMIKLLMKSIHIYYTV